MLFSDVFDDFFVHCTACRLYALWNRNSAERKHGNICRTAADICNQNAVRTRYVERTAHCRRFWCFNKIHLANTDWAYCVYNSSFFNLGNLTRDWCNNPRHSHLWRTDLFYKNWNHILNKFGAWNNTVINWVHCSYACRRFANHLISLVADADNVVGVNIKRNNACLIKHYSFIFNKNSCSVRTEINSYIHFNHSNAISAEMCKAYSNKSHRICTC